MKKINFNLIEEICKKQDFDELLLQILEGSKKNRINQILQDIDKNKNLDNELKRKVYKEIFEYIDDVNTLLKDNLKEIFSIAIKQTIIKRKLITKRITVTTGRTINNGNITVIRNKPLKKNQLLLVKTNR